MTDLNKKFTKLTGNVIRINFITKKLEKKSIEAQLPPNTNTTHGVKVNVKDGDLIILCHDSHAPSEYDDKLKRKVKKIYLNLKSKELRGFKWVRSIEFFQRYLVYTDENPCSYATYDVEGKTLPRDSSRDKYWEYVLTDKICKHENRPRGISSANQTEPMKGNDKVICPDCRAEVEICWSCGGMVDDELYNETGYDGTDLCQNMDMSPDGCDGVDTENYHVDEKTAQWVENEY